MRGRPDVNDNNKISQSLAPLPVERNHTRHKTTHCAACSDPAMLQAASCLRHQRERPWGGVLSRSVHGVGSIEGVAKGGSSGGVVKGGAIMNDWSEGVKELSGVSGLSELLPIH